MGVFADADDVAARFEGHLSPEQRTWLDIKIIDAESLLIGHVSRLAFPANLTETDLNNAKRVVCEAVLKVLRNPGGFESERTGPWSATRFQDNASGLIEFTKDQLAVFRRTRKQRFGMIGIAPPKWGES